MNQQQQDARRRLKRERRALDRIAQEIAAANPKSLTGLPSTRSKQAKANRVYVAAVMGRRDTYNEMRARMAEITAELERTR